MGELKGIILLRFSNVLLEPRWVFQVFKNFHPSGYLQIMEVVRFIYENQWDMNPKWQKERSFYAKCGNHS